MPRLSACLVPVHLPALFPISPCKHFKTQKFIVTILTCRESCHGLAVATISVSTCASLQGRGNPALFNIAVGERRCVQASKDIGLVAIHEVLSGLVACVNLCRQARTG